MKPLFILAIAASLVQPAAAVESHAGGAAGGHHAQGSQPAEAAQRATASGTIRAIAPAEGVMTIAHGPVPSLSWPPMVMDFSADPQLLADLRVGDRVEFEFSSADMSRILALRLQAREP